MAPHEMDPHRPLHAPDDADDEAAPVGTSASSGAEVPLSLGRLRQERGLSLAALAELTGVSKSMLRQIEMGQSSPTIATLWKIANGLRVPFSVLLAPPEVEVTVRDVHARGPLRGDTPGYRLYPLVPFAPDRGLELYLVELDPGTHLDAAAHPQRTLEHVVVQQGVLRVTVGDQVHTVRAGQIMSFGADQPHAYDALEGGPVACVMALSYRF
jgi:XRE family transcriptional regulator, regulator of sulfur utilization